jgi:O-antigen ligase
LSRPAIWLYYLTALRIHPITGGGVSTSILYGPVHWTRTAGGSSVAVVLPTENSYLTTAIETGLVGLALLLIAVVGALVRGLRLARRYPDLPVAQAAGIAGIGLAAILAGNLTVDAFNGEILGVLMGILMGIIVAANRLEPRSRAAASA